jgi:iron complex outermembrane receptor protein
MEKKSFVKTVNPYAFCFNHWTRYRYAIFNSLHKTIKIGVISFSCSMVQQTAQPLLAQSSLDSTSSIIKTQELDEVEVAATASTRWPDLARPTVTLSRSALESYPARSLDELLKYLPRVDIRQRGIDGVQSDLSLNGGSFDQVLILLNGNNITDPQTGHFNLDLPIDLDHIERIEIVQGSAARTLGSNAFSGVFNLITNVESEEPGLHGKGAYTTGPWHYSNLGLSASLQHPNWNLFGSTALKSSDGYRDNTDFTTHKFFSKEVTNPPHLETVFCKWECSIKGMAPIRFTACFTQTSMKKQRLAFLPLTGLNPSIKRPGMQSFIKGYTKIYLSCSEILKQLLPGIKTTTAT